MDAVLNIIGIVGAAWLLLSILLALAWAAGGRKIFRKPPVQPPVISIAPRTDAEKAFVAELKRIRMNGRSL